MPDSVDEGLLIDIEAHVISSDTVLVASGVPVPSDSDAVGRVIDTRTLREGVSLRVVVADADRDGMSVAVRSWVKLGVGRTV